MARFVSVKEAVAAIPDGATVALDGFTMMGVAEAVAEEIERSFLAGGHPRDLVLVHAAGQSNRKQGFEHFAHEGLATRVIGSHWGLMPRMSSFLAADRSQAVCLPQGQLSHLYRAIAAGQPGNLSRVGLGTFVDPRIEGGKINRSARESAPDYVELLKVRGEDHLLYHSFPIHVGVIRATSVDESGNASHEEEAVTLDAIGIAQAARNSGGLVICQAKRRVPRGSIRPKEVTIPGSLIDLVVIAPDPDRQHRQTDRVAFDPSYTSASPPGPDRRLPPAPFSNRLVIGRRAVRFLHAGDVVNIGTGIPGDTVGPALDEGGQLSMVTLTVESGVYGGVPAGGVDFGIAAFPDAIIPHPSQFDFYNGGGLDATFMGAGEIDRFGNVNVSRLGDRVIGCGGFIDITQTAKRVIFCFSFEGRHPKFVTDVGHLTFSAAQALKNGQQVVYVSEQAVFELHPDGLHLVEVAPGIDPAAIVSAIPFAVKVEAPLRRLPADIFEPQVQSFSLETPGGSIP
ncbi:acyl CoA:acetate/3-ketoacid CoA transferase [bacterium]|nr:MAG: acyl CoA:acetate/3-ketoacid CoA transferase [bacterium]